MNYQFVPLMNLASSTNSTPSVPICVKKGDYMYNECNEISNGILTPTTPSTVATTKLITDNSSPFFQPPPFQPFSYSNSPKNNYYNLQVSPIEYSPSDKPSQSLYNYNGDVDGYGGYYDNYSNSVIDTPDSIIIDESTNKECQFNEYDDTYFRFDPETIEKFSSTLTDVTPQHDILDLDADYINFNEENCNSKNQSPCSSPLDPWIVSNAMIESSKSPKIENIQPQQLPSISQVFSNFQGNSESSMAYNILNTFDSSFFDDFTVSNVKSEENFNNYDNINYDNFSDDKPNREFKVIWDEDEKQEFFNDFNEEKLINSLDVPESKPKRQKKQQKTKEIQDTPSEHQPDVLQQMICFWADCYQEFNNQTALVKHIEKCHVCVIKGDEYTCLWTECPRQYRSFNARYKLLIHMRVHSGEKPNKCPFPGCPKAFSRLENLKIHQRSHTGERPYCCTFQNCTKAFSNSSDRAKHQRTHFDTRPYACQLPGCTKRYTDPSSLRKHVKNHDFKGRRKSSQNKDFKQHQNNTKIRHKVSESSFSCVTPSTPLTPNNKLEKLNSEQSYEIVADKVATSMNFEEMSNCLITLIDHSSIKNDSCIPGENFHNKRISYESTENNYDNVINYNEQQSLDVSHYFT